MQSGDPKQRLNVAVLRVVKDHPELAADQFDNREMAEEKRRAAYRLAKAGEYQTQPGQTVMAYINHGRWVADCPACNGAELVEQGHRMLCGSCGAVHDVDWPSDIDEAETLLEQRPVGHQHWDRHKGETVDTLAAENIDHGILPEDLRL